MLKATEREELTEMNRDISGTFERWGLVGRN
jgi:hypothetical protein